MKTFLKVISYFMSIMMLVGVLALVDDSALDGYAFAMFILIEAQSIVTLVFLNSIEKKKLKK